MSTRPTLPDGEALCRPSGHCPRKTHCLRWLAELGGKHRLLSDFNLWAAGGECAHFISVQEWAPEPAPRQVKPWPSN